MSAFTCYFDASGTQHDQLVLAVGGFMSTAELWVDFETAWLSRLQKAGLKAFHRKTFSPKNHPGLLEDLASIIRDHVNRQVGMVVRVAALHSLVPAEDYKKWNLDAYSYGGRGCAAHVRMWAKQNHLRAMPELVFARGDAGRNELETRLRKDGFDNVQFRPALDEYNRKTGLIEPAVIPLQAADLYAYELFHASREIEMEPSRRGRTDLLTPVWCILEKIEGKPQITSAKSLASFNQRIGGSV